MTASSKSIMTLSVEILRFVKKILDVKMAISIDRVIK